MKSITQFLTAGLMLLTLMATAHAAGLGGSGAVKRFHDTGGFCSCTCNGKIWQCEPKGCTGLEGQACSLDSRSPLDKSRLTKSIDIKPVIFPGDQFKGKPTRFPGKNFKRNSK